MKEVNHHTSDVSSGTGKCPVKHGPEMVEQRSPTFWASMFSTKEKKLEPTTVSSASCPVNSSSVPASLEEAAHHAQTPHPEQRIPLGTNRQVSSIFRGSSSDLEVPQHQHDNSEEKWVYPSEQQLYNAMRKKGWSNIPEESIPTVLQIHNNINERTWRQIQQWEGSDELQLTRFQGRPSDMTPKAFLLCKLLRLYEPPFDRHDWYVANPNAMYGVTQRYVIDYYYLPTSHPNEPPIPYVDARPALDHPRAIFLQSRQFCEAAFPGIAFFIKNWQHNVNKSDDSRK